MFGCSNSVPVRRSKGFRFLRSVFISKKKFELGSVARSDGTNVREKCLNTQANCWTFKVV